MRDPWVDPWEGDVIDIGEGRIVVVDRVHVGWVSYRVCDAGGGLLAASRVPLGKWREGPR